MLKGELELARGDIDLCQSDLQQVLFLLESSTGELPGPSQAWWEDLYCNMSLYIKVWLHAESDRCLVPSDIDFRQNISVPLAERICTSPTLLGFSTAECLWLILFVLLFVYLNNLLCSSGCP